MASRNLFHVAGSLAVLSFVSGKAPETYTVYINYPDYSVRACVLKDAGKLRPRDGHTYYWYADNDIKRTDGGFDGRLLHGEYKSFYIDKNLREQGTFRHGLKEATWKSWFPGGRIREICHYNNGKPDGLCERFDENGKLVSAVHYKDGLQHGKTVMYTKGIKDTTISYKRGHPRPGKKNDQKQPGKQKKAGRKGTKDSAQDTLADTPKSRKSTKKVVNKTPSDSSQQQKKDTAGKSLPAKRTSKKAR